VEVDSGAPRSFDVGGREAGFGSQGLRRDAVCSDGMAVR
jgi:hypothetical protein